MQSAVTMTLVPNDISKLESLYKIAICILDNITIFIKLFLYTQPKYLFHRDATSRALHKPVNHLATEAIDVVAFIKI